MAEIDFRLGRVMGDLDEAVARLEVMHRACDQSNDPRRARVYDLLATLRNCRHATTTIPLDGEVVV